MTYKKALAIIRASTRNGDTLDETFKIICRNRYSHPVRDWAIFDMMQETGLDYDSAERRYYRHLSRLFAIFVSARSPIYGGVE